MSTAGPQLIRVGTPSCYFLYLREKLGILIRAYQRFEAVGLLFSYKSKGYIFVITDRKFWEDQVLQALEAKAEYNFLDFKKELSPNKDRMKEHINAFGNLERGGCFVFGVENFVPVGIEASDNIIKYITNLAKQHQVPSLDVDPFVIKVNDKSLLCIHVLSGESKPVFIKDRQPLGGQACFKRTGASTAPMSIAEIKDLLSNSQDVYYDQSSLKDVRLEELDLEKIVDLLSSMESPKEFSPKTLSILVDNQVLTPTKEVTVAGWLCFAKDPQSVRQFRNAYIEFQLFKGTMRDTPIRKYEIKGRLSDQIEKAVYTLKEHVWLVPQIHNIKREDVPAYSDIVLREVITNSLVHRDYRKMHQPVKIAMFSNRIEIENPGGLLPGITVDNLIHKRDWRNPLLAELMKKFGLGEMDGQGIDRLYAEILKIKIPPPKITDHHSSFKIMLSAPKKYEEYSAEEKRLTLIILAVLKENVDNESVRGCLGISAEKASTLIKAMVEENVFEAISASRKYAKYALTKKYRERIFG